MQQRPSEKRRKELSSLMVLYSGQAEASHHVRASLFLRCGWRRDSLRRLRKSVCFQPRRGPFAFSKGLESKFNGTWSPICDRMTLLSANVPKMNAKYWPDKLEERFFARVQSFQISRKEISLPREENFPFCLTIFDPCKRFNFN